MEAIEVRWDELLEQTERHLAQSWFERPLLPLSIALLDAEVRKHRACRRAIEISKARHLGPPAEKRAAAKFEEWVQTTDGKIGGFIDAAVRERGRLILRDYKSGGVQNLEDGVIKEEYAIQLRLYAALYAETFKEWPDELELVPLQGAARSVAFDPAGCEELCATARKALDTTNAAISSLSNAPVKTATMSIARPSPESCRFCQYRPMCVAYQLERRSRPAEGWPEDAFGVVKDLRLLGNGSALLVLEETDTVVPQIKLRGIDPDVSRHPALNWLRPGVPGAVFGMRPTGRGDYIQQASTVLYASDQAKNGGAGSSTSGPNCSVS